LLPTKQKTHNKSIHIVEIKKNHIKNEEIKAGNKKKIKKSLVIKKKVLPLQPFSDISDQIEEKRY
jgi:hypothetical protein